MGIAAGLLANLNKIKKMMTEDITGTRFYFYQRSPDELNVKIRKAETNLEDTKKRLSNLLNCIKKPGLSHLNFS